MAFMPMPSLPFPIGFGGIGALTPSDPVGALAGAPLTMAGVDTIPVIGVAAGAAIGDITIITDTIRDTTPVGVAAETTGQATPLIQTVVGTVAAIRIRIVVPLLALDCRVVARKQELLRVVQDREQAGWLVLAVRV